MHTTLNARHFSGLLRTAVLLAGCLLFIMASGCSSRRLSGDLPPEGAKQTGTQPRGTKPYTVMGRTYYPLLDAHGYSEEGVASWYGKDFHGKKTANGETYDMHSMTAAHKLLPFGTQLRVTNLDNGRSITVRVNDRGPFVADRVIDLTRSGAEKLDMLGPGTARVRLESIGTVPGQRGNDLIGNFYVQVGAFTIKENAHRLAKNIQAKGTPSRVVYVPDIGFHRVQIGPYSSLTTAENAATALQAEFPNNFVVAQ